MSEPVESPQGGAEIEAERGRPEPGDDFFCLRFRVWYPSHDCAIRTRFRTYRGCARCDQGRFNLKRHADALGAVRFTALRGIAAGETDEA